MRDCIRKLDEAAEFYSDERCFILELLNTSEDEEVSIARARVAPGVTTALHRLSNAVERYVILAGQGRVEIGDLPPTDVVPGDLVVIQVGTPQRISNTGDSDLVFLCICTPRFRQECYESLEQ